MAKNTFLPIIYRGDLPPHLLALSNPHICPIETDLRPISLTPTLAKQFQWFVSQWILEEVTPQINERQFGAVKGRSTTHALVDRLHHCHEALDAGKSV